MQETENALGVGTSVLGKRVLWVDDHPEWTLGERELLPSAPNPIDIGKALSPGPFEVELAGLEPATSWVRSPR